MHIYAQNVQNGMKKKVNKMTERSKEILKNALQWKGTGKFTYAELAIIELLAELIKTVEKEGE
jgi:hypothetical protein